MSIDTLQQTLHNLQRNIAAISDAPPESSQQAINELLDRAAAITPRYSSVVFGSMRMQLLHNRARIMSMSIPNDIPITITGPTGAGKEVFAKIFRQYLDKPFVAVNMAAIPEQLISSILFGHVKGAFTGALDTQPGAFRAAGDGVILLDEVGDMPLDLQPVLLRVIQERVVTPVGDPAKQLPINCRIIATTNCQLDDPTKFRPDLYARLNMIRIDIPALTDPTREGDLEALAELYGLDSDDLRIIRGDTQLSSYLEQHNVRAVQAFAARKRYTGTLRIL